jgi:integrase
MKGIIYKIICPDGYFYFDCTMSSLSKRKNAHKVCFKTLGDNNMQKKLYEHLRLFNWDDLKFECVEECDCNYKKELYARKEFYIFENKNEPKCLNSNSTLSESSIKQMNGILELKNQNLELQLKLLQTQTPVQEKENEHKHEPIVRSVQEEKVPVFISETEDFIQLKHYIRQLADQKKIQPGHLNMAFDLLSQVLYRMYSQTSIQTLIKRSVLPKESIIFSCHMNQSYLDAGWTRRTTTTIIHTLKKILNETSIDKDFVKLITLDNPKVKAKNDDWHILPLAYKNLSENDPIKIKVLKWVDTIKNNTKNKSTASMRNIMYFILGKFIAQLGVSIEDSDEVLIKIIKTKITQQFLSYFDNKKQLTWIKMFLNYVLKIEIEPELLKSSESVNVKTLIEEDSHDKHLISVEELEIIYQHSKEAGVMIELIFMLLLTTGMRVGGLVNIKTENVLTYIGDTIDIKNTGRTIEKGNKWFSFVLNTKVKELIYKWVTSERKSVNSEYLFPSRNGTRPNITTGTVRKMFNSVCKDAGLNGTHLHPHALRHSYAHILLNSGNSVDIVSKLLGHSSSSTTEKFYLKETASDVAERANIPWLDKSLTCKKVVPDFLKCTTQPEPTKDRIAKKRMKNMSKLDIFKPKITMNTIHEN